MSTVFLGDKQLRRAGLAVFGAGGLAFLFAAFVPLAEGLAAGGTLVVESDRQVVQHLEGGIVSEIFVSEGDEVEAGEALMALSHSATESRRDEVRSEHASVMAATARLEALIEGRSTPDFSNLETIALDAADLSSLIDAETLAFHEELAALRGEIEVLEARRQSAAVRADSKRAELQSTMRERHSIVEELDLAKSLLAEGMGTIQNVQAKVRDQAALDTRIAAYNSDISQAESDMADIAAQIRDVKARFRRDKTNQLAELRARASVLTSQERAAEDSVARFIVTAPRAGEVLNLKYKTIGGVVRPGDEILEIVPRDSDAIVEAKIAPGERAQVFEGLDVRATLSAYRGWQAEPVPGRILAVSADLKQDAVTGEDYYEARIALDGKALAELQGVHPLPGMPVQLFIFSGSHRTTLDYLLAPLFDSAFEGWRAR